MTGFKRALFKYSLAGFFICVVAVAISSALGAAPRSGPFAVAAFALLALCFMGHPRLESFAFTIWVFAFVAASMFYPQAFMTWATFDLKVLIVPLIQIIMFGMGTTLSPRDFGRVCTMPWPVLIGIVLQFSVMPLAGYTIATTFGFEAEVAAGVILIGSCPGGVASNLMTYLARGNVALSVTMTSCSTLLSPLLTPLMMTMLAGRLVPIDFVGMMISILNMIIVPILAGLVANRILYGKGKWERNPAVLAMTVIVSGAVALAMAFAGNDTISSLLSERFAGPLLSLRSGTIIGFGLIAVVALAKLVVNVMLRGPENWMDRVLPVVSMAGICFIIALITARSQQKLLTVGVALIAAAILHNFVGYLLGYGCARLARLDQTACRTVAIEVGLQNGGMASGLAMTVLKSANAALAPAIFGPWMNVSGSMLATWWHRKPVTDAKSDGEHDEPASGERKPES